MNIEKHIEAIIRTIDPDAHDLQRTPARVSDAFEELYSGYKHDPKTRANVLYNSEMDEMVILKNIPFESNCEHHLMPMIGEVSVGYLPCGRIIGLSKLARIVDCYAHRMQLQERFTMEVAQAINSIIEPKGVAVHVRAEHFCLTHRGVKKAGTHCVTRYFLGKIKENPELRKEFLEEINA
ncbi:MAG: GTP cyclohydrolase I FolE [Holosporaceae bacterium]|jgi:GTP cyclohydrolase I|nr:GTP cyclohydrolase I FolE [Holosporaceae bacterium]